MKKKILWCVIQGADYEGEWFPSLRLFSTKEKAEKYVSERKDTEDCKYTQFYIETREIDNTEGN
jgi:hypothetical protein